MSAHGDLEFVAAARLLARALNPEQKPPLTGADRDRALVYLGSAYVNQNENDKAATAFRDLVIGNPRYRPDALIFPPPVTHLFDDVVQTTKAVAVDLAAQQTVIAGKDMPIRVYASSAHQISATILRGSGDTVATLFDGPITDSLTLSWNGLTTGQRPTPSGSYRLEITSKLSPTTVIRAVRIPLEIQTTALDTTPPLPSPSDSLFLPERRPFGPALIYLVPGVVLGTVLMVPHGLGGGRFVLGGSIVVGGVVGFALQHPGRTIPANVQSNARMREDWARRVEAGKEQARLRGSHGLLIRAGPPQRVEQPG